MLDQDEIANQQKLLAAHRRTLAVYRHQQAQLGILTPPGVVNGIAETAAQIRHVKAILHSNGVAVEDHPDDDPSDLARPVHHTDQPLYFLPDSLPPGYVERTEALAALRGALLESRAAGGVVAVTALHGLGGLGKTVLARAICDDKAVRDAFPDGILWATLGQSAEPARHQRDWTAVLGGDVAAASSPERGKVELRRQLEQRSMLLVLDDVWSAGDATPLQVGGPRCATLITTRDASQVEHAALVPLERMRQAESRALLRGAARGKLDDERLADTISARLGHLPLALSIVGALLARAVPWPDIAEALDEGDLTFLEHGQKSVLAAISASVRALPNEQAARYRELVIFPDDEPLAESAVARLWKATAGLKGREARRLLVDLRDRAMIQADSRLHDLQYDYLRAEVAPAAQRHLHGVLANAYTDPSTGLPTSGDDLYGWERLAYHLARAERNDELRSLLYNGTYLQEKITRLGTAALLTDFRLLPGDQEIDRMAGALRLGAHVLDREPRQLENELVGRMMPPPKLYNLPDDGRPRLRLLSQTLTAPGGALVRTLTGHTDSVASCVFSSDGRQALSASADRTLRLWDIATGQTVRIFEGHTSWVSACAFSPNGTFALSASGDRTLRLWDIATGQTVRVFVGHSDGVNSCAFSPDGKLALSASGDRTLRLWDIATGQTIHVLEGHNDDVAGCAFSPNGELALSSSDDRTLWLWDVATGQAVGVLEGHTGGVRACAFGPDGTLALSASDDRTLRLWDVATGQTVQVLKGHVLGVESCTFSADGSLALSGSKDEDLRIWDVASGRCLRNLEVHGAPIKSCIFSPDGRFVLSASRDRTLRLSDLTTNDVTERPSSMHARGIRHCAFSPIGETLLTASSDRTLRLWDTTSRQSLLVLQGHANVVNGCVFSPDGTLALSASADHTLRLWDVADGQTVRVFDGHSSYVNSCVFNPDGTLALSASADRTLRLWDVAGGQARQVLDGHLDVVWSCAFSPDGLLALSASQDHSLRLWDVARGQTLRVLEGHTDTVADCAFSPDGTLALSASRDETLRLWNLTSGRTLHVLKGHADHIHTCTFSPDGRLALSASRDLSLRSWDVASGTEIARWHADLPLVSCAFHPDGQRIVVGCSYGTLHWLRLENI
jgi:WD40 repeat protein